MNRARSISYAPAPASGTCRNRQPAVWTLCRRFESFPVRDDAMLEDWTERGRVRPDDYLVRVEPDLCVQARDVVELDAIFRRTRARLLGKVWRTLACSTFLLAWIEPLSAAVVLVCAFAAAVACYRPADPPQTYFLHTDRDLRERRITDGDLAPTRATPRPA